MLDRSYVVGRQSPSIWVYDNQTISPNSVLTMVIADKYVISEDWSELDAIYRYDLLRYRLNWSKDPLMFGPRVSNMGLWLPGMDP